MFVLVAVKLLLVFMTTIFALLTILKLVKELLEFTTKGVDMYVQIVVKSLLKKIHLLKGFTDILMTWLTLYLMTLLTFIVSLKLAKTTICHLRMLLDL